MLQRRQKYWAFLDVSKAYDPVLREGLWIKMRENSSRKNLSIYANACMKELRRVCYWLENVLDGLKWRQD